MATDESASMPVLSGERFTPPSEAQQRERAEALPVAGWIFRHVPIIGPASRVFFSLLEFGEWRTRARREAWRLVCARGEVPETVWTEPRLRAIGAHIGKLCNRVLRLPSSRYHPDDLVYAVILAAERTRDEYGDDDLLYQSLDADFSVSIPHTLRGREAVGVTMGQLAAFISEHTSRSHLPPKGRIPVAEG